MSTVVESFDAWGHAAPGEYPLDEWLDGRTHRIVHSDLRSMGFADLARYLHRAAKRRGLACRTKRWDWDAEAGIYMALYVEAWDPYLEDRCD